MLSDLFICDVVVRRDEVPDPDAYPYNLPVFRGLSRLHLSRRVTYLVGENGTGKSTLLEAIAVGYGFNPEGGTRNFRFSTKATHSELYRHLSLVKGMRRPQDGFFLRAESFYNVASQIDRMDEEDRELFPGKPSLLESYGGASMHAQSHGESFLSLVLNRFSANGLYLLDEPESALSPSRQLSLLTRMDDLVRAGSQFIVATHSPILMAYPGAEIWVLSEEGMTRTPYKETEHYLLTRQILNNPEGLMRTLLEEEAAEEEE